MGVASPLDGIGSHIALSPSTRRRNEHLATLSRYFHFISSNLASFALSREVMGTRCE